MDPTLVSLVSDGGPWAIVALAMTALGVLYRQSLADRATERAAAEAETAARTALLERTIVALTRVEERLGPKSSP